MVPKWFVLARPVTTFNTSLSYSAVPTKGPRISLNLLILAMLCSMNMRFLETRPGA